MSEKEKNENLEELNPEEKTVDEKEEAFEKYENSIEKEDVEEEKEASEEVKEETPKEKIMKLELEIQEWKNSYTRKLAEFQNFSRRKENEVSEMKKYASEGIIVKLLDNIDNLERAVVASEEIKNSDSLIEGVKMTLNNLKNLLIDEGVEEVEALGKEYNPYEHQAMMTETKEELDNDVIVQVFQKGYKLKGKVIRPSMVTVNKK
ncbi:MAG: nucleotide exchange factor GrpE [Leptotrichiaceae bacterium]|nr:nucleotide exchange factor GrpE [Leptotrichiaceae bacterium]MBP7101108.1 nucleotide exchange factor GrpE [Leptotrichiaceae bacterium]MBP7739733.1 nucleotide exchange factor GrpE [Leptotrichiaceae bacterium]MBP9630248.1 nucleotide exchange factor GrpE [Leptotrichiaceae bacterium]